MVLSVHTRSKDLKDYRMGHSRFNYPSAICGPANLRLYVLPNTPIAGAWPVLGGRQASDSIPHSKRVPVTRETARGPDSGSAGWHPSNLTISHLIVALLLHILALHRLRHFWFILGRLSTLFCQVVASLAISSNFCFFNSRPSLPTSAPKQVFQVNKPSHDSRSKYYCTPPVVRRSLPLMSSSSLHPTL